MGLLFALLTTFATISCHPTQSVDKQVIISLEKTFCYGTCPVYKTTIAANGTVNYHGEKFTPYIGETTTQLTESQLNNLLLDFEAIKFEQYNDEYVNNRITDIPSTIIMYKGKKVTMRSLDVPPKLMELANKTEKVIEESLN